MGVLEAALASGDQAVGEWRRPVPKAGGPQGRADLGRLYKTDTAICGLRFKEMNKDAERTYESRR